MELILQRLKRLSLQGVSLDSLCAFSLAWKRSAVKGQWQTAFFSNGKGSLGNFQYNDHSTSTKQGQKTVLSHQTWNNDIMLPLLIWSVFLLID